MRGQLGPDLASECLPVSPISVPGKEPPGALSLTGPAGQGGFSCETLLVNSATPGRQEHSRLDGKKYFPEVFWGERDTAARNFFATRDPHPRSTREPGPIFQPVRIPIRERIDPSAPEHTPERDPTHF